MTSVESIAKRIRKISDHPAALRVFGARSAVRPFGHSFKMNTHNATELSALESHLGVSLPLEYIQLLTMVGSSVGPYYGLYSPNQMIEEIADLSCGISPVSPAKSFRISREDLDDLSVRIAQDSDLRYIDCPWPSDGCVPICFQGCTFWTALVTAGEFTGSVWDVARFKGYEGQWVPARRAPGIVSIKGPELPALPTPPTLAEWYMAWLERIEDDVLAPG